MTTRRRFLTASAAGVALACGWPAAWAHASNLEQFEVTRTDAEWRKLLTADQYAVLRHEATERAFTSALLHEKRRGTFACAGCALDTFSSATQFDSGTGWPSFWAPIDKAVVTKRDTSLGMVRTAVECRRLRRPSWSRIRRRAQADWLAILHQWRRADLQADVVLMKTVRIFSGWGWPAVAKRPLSR